MFLPCCLADVFISQKEYPPKLWQTLLVRSSFSLHRGNEHILKRQWAECKGQQYRRQSWLTSRGRGSQNKCYPERPGHCGRNDSALFCYLRKGIPLGHKTADACADPCHQACILEQAMFFHGTSHVI